MAVTVKSLGIDNLNVEDRLALIGELWDSISSETETLPLSAELKNELDRRLKDAELNPSSSKSWDQVKEDTLSRLKK